MSSLWIFCVIHVKYQFHQVYLELLDCIKNHQYQSLHYVFNYHIITEKDVHQLNSEMRYYIYILYKVIKPTFNIFVFLSFSSDINLIPKIISSLITLLIASMMFMMNILCTSVLSIAHKPQYSLYNTVLSRNHNIPLKIRLKIMRFIERLSGPEIGFYCYDLFPMNSYNFTDYALDSIYSFLLIIKMLKNNGFIN